MKLLIVDDSLIIRKAIERNVRQAEITEVFQAENGAVALQIFQRERPELITMDLTMPQLDGIACLTEMQNSGQSASILVISALNSHRTAMEAIAHGACGFLVKPFTPLELIEAFKDLVLHAQQHGTRP